MAETVVSTASTNPFDGDAPSTNPFDDEEEEEKATSSKDSEKAPNEKIASTQEIVDDRSNLEQGDDKSKSTNPFDDDEGNEDFKKPVRVKQADDEKSKSTNPFDDDDDNIGKENLKKSKKMVETVSTKEVDDNKSKSTNPFEESGDLGIDDGADRATKAKIKKASNGKKTGIGFLASRAIDIEVDADMANVPVATDEIDFLEDKKSEMTLARRIALQLMKFRWYYPKPIEEEEDENQSPIEEDINDVRKDGSQRSLVEAAIQRAATEAYPFTVAQLPTPDLEHAWAYFEHFTLPRYMLEEKKMADHGDDDDHGKGKDSKGNEVPVDVEEEKEAESEEAGDELSFNSENRAQLSIRRKPVAGSKPTFNRAEPGEAEVPTKLYNPFCVPHKELGDWGLGVGLYFTTLRAIAIITLVAGILSIPNLAYYAGKDYSDNQPDVPAHLKGSAICTDTSWVPCTNCKFNDFPDDRIATGTQVMTTGMMKNDTFFVLRNNCEGATIPNGILNLVVLLVVVVGIQALNVIVDRAEVAFDEDEQTAQDYSIVIKNPPPDAHDPKVWKDFFYDNFDNAHVTAVTVGVENDLLVRNLVTRRENLRLIEMKVPPGTPLDTLTIARIAAEEERGRKLAGRLFAAVAPGIPEHFAKVVVASGKIQGLAQQPHPVSNIFVTFETEADQRRVLKALSVGKRAVQTQDIDALENPNHAFCNADGSQTVLRVREPEEPSDIRWHDLNEPAGNRFRQQALTIFATLVTIVVIAIIVRAVNDVDVRYSAFVIAIFNTLFPIFAKFLTWFEAHGSESNKQKSLYFKVALFRWVNTAVVITIITPFTYSLQNEQGLLQQVYSLFFAEIVTSTAIQLADIGGHISRHFSAPRAKNQWSMNLAMQGGDFDLSERYTNMTKFLLLSVWFNAIFPASFFLCSVAFLINYFVDRFSLMRTWKRIPNIGPRIASFSRDYFFSSALVAMAILSSYYWSGFPYDNVCSEDNSSSNVLAGEWLIEIKGSGNTTMVVVSSTDPSFIYCKQDFFRYYDSERSFPFVGRNQPDENSLQWMTGDQEIVTNIWGWVSVAVLAAVILKIFFTWAGNIISYFKGGYEPRGEDQGKNFSQLESISGYVPQVKSRVFECPLLAASIDSIDTELLDWEAIGHPFSFYDLTLDAKFLLKGRGLPDHLMFSQIAHWPASEEDLAEIEAAKAVARQVIEASVDDEAENPVEEVTITENEGFKNEDSLTK